MRVLQEYRRINSETMPIAAITAIKHPVGGGEAPALSLADKGFLATDAARENFTLTQKAKDFLAIDVKPDVEEPASATKTPKRSNDCTRSGAIFISRKLLIIKALTCQPRPFPPPPRRLLRQ